MTVQVSSYLRNCNFKGFNSARYGVKVCCDLEIGCGDQNTRNTFENALHLRYYDLVT